MLLPLRLEERASAFKIHLFLRYLKNFWQTYRLDFHKNWQLAYPVIISQAGEIMVSQVDTIMIGRLGPENLAAISLGTAVFMLIVVFGVGITSGISPLVAHASGERKPAAINIIFKHGLLTAAVLGIVMMILLLSCAPLIGHLNQPAIVVSLALPYIRIISLSLLPVMLFFALRRLGEGLGDTKPFMRATLVGNLVNIVLDYLLIFGKWGLPRLGIVGAGIGTLTAQVCMLCFILYSYRRRENFRRVLLGVRHGGYQRVHFKRLLGLGIPSALQGLFEVGLFASAAFVSGLVGVKALAAHQVGVGLAAMTFLMCSGFGVAATIRVGHNLGDKAYKTMRRVGFSALFMGIGFMLITGLLFVALRDLLPSIYTDDPQVISLASTLLLVAALFQISDGAQVVLLGALRGLQDVKIPTLITFLAYWVIAFPVGYILAIPVGWGVVGVWIGLCTGLTLSALLLYIRYTRQTRRLIRDLDHENT